MRYRRMLAWVIILALLSLGLVHIQSRVPVISEDTNANGIPDIVEFQKSMYAPLVGVHLIPTVAVFTVTGIVVYVSTTYMDTVVDVKREHRNDFDFFAKLFKSKMREVV